MPVMDSAPVIVLFRRDLRTEDNGALAAAAATGRPVLPLYIHDPDDPLAPGAAAKWWLHRSLEALARELRRLGATLRFRQGPANAAVMEAVRATGAAAVYWNRRYAAPHIALDTALKSNLKADGIEARSFSGFLLREPNEVATAAGTPFQIYSAFRRELRRMGPTLCLAPAPRLRDAPDPAPADLDCFALLPRSPNWAAGFEECWRPGEAGAQAALDAFLESRATAYAADRNLPGAEGTSRLSPHLAFGEIAPARIWAQTRMRIESGALPGAGAETFLDEILWREFSWHALHHHPRMRKEALRPAFEDFPWRDDPEALAAWRRGRTGYPVVDAGMRQLWKTGWMHNRVRMIAASFLVKNLLLPWQAGEAWFWDTLVDADPASNAASWQWVAGSGFDAAPYFRIFNPVLQGEKFDPSGDYVRRYAPELSRLPDVFIHKPWDAPAEILSAAGIALGRDYPAPIVDHAAARARALEAYQSMRKTGVENDRRFG